MKQKLIFLFNLLFFFIYLLVCSISVAAPQKTIRFATEATYPPFEYVDESGNLTGFDIALAQALCQAIKTHCTFTNQSFSSLIPSLKLGKFDALIAAIGTTNERKKQIAFSNIYFVPSASFVIPQAAHLASIDISKKIIGVQTGTLFERYLLTKYSQTNSVKSYQSIQDAFLDLIAGRLDLVLADTPIAESWLRQGNHAKKYEIMPGPVQDAHYFGEGYAIAVRKDNTQLLDLFNQALKQIKENGTYDKLVQRFLSS